MTNYRHVCNGVIDGVGTWSFGWYSISGSTEGAAETAWHNGIQALFTSTGFAALLPTGVNVTGTSTSTLNAAWKQTTKTSTPSSVTGAATTALPPHVCEVVTWRTANSNRSGHGRWYLPALSTGALATGGYSISSAAQTSIQTALNAFLATIRGTLQPVILHRHGTKTGLAPLSTDNIIKGDVPNLFDTQRRRAEKLVATRVALTF